MKTVTKLLNATILATALSLGTTQIVSAHHSSAPHFDNTIDISKTGVVTDWKFVNPHSYIYLDVTEADGTVNNWRCEGSAATALRRLNFTDETFVPGMTVTVNGNPARREDNVCLVLSITYQDGVTVGRNGQVPDDKVRGEVFEDSGLSTAHEQFLTDGVTPNFAGYWVAQRRARGGGGAGGMGSPAGDAMGAPAEGGMGGGMGAPGGGARIALTDAGQAAEANYEQIYDDPTIKCGISNIIFGMGHDQNVNQITQTDDKITLLYGFMDYARTIYLDGRDFPETITPSDGGYSIGAFEGDTLVVRSKGFLPSVIHPLGGGSYSNQMQATERFTYDKDSNAIKRAYVISDPLYIVGEYTGDDQFVKSDQAYTPYNCVELSGINNLRPGTSEYEAELKRMEAETVSASAAPEVTLGQKVSADTTSKPWWLVFVGAAALLGLGLLLKRKKT